MITTCTEWKVEWLDQEGVGHWFESTDMLVTRQFIEAVSPIAATLDVYRRECTDWERNPECL